MFNNYIGAVTGENLDEHSLHVCWEETLTAVPRLPGQTSRFYEICVAPPTFPHLLIHPPPLPPPPATDFALNRERQISVGHRNCERQSSVCTAGSQPRVGTARPQLRAPELSGHYCRASTPSARAQWALPDLNCESQISVGTAGPQLRVQDVTYSRMSHRMSEEMPDRRRDRMSEYMPERSRKNVK